jgi:hypothetical protein
MVILRATSFLEEHERRLVELFFPFIAQIKVLALIAKFTWTSSINLPNAKPTNVIIPIIVVDIKCNSAHIIP